MEVAEESGEELDTGSWVGSRRPVRGILYSVASLA